MVINTSEVLVQQKEQLITQLAEQRKKNEEMTDKRDRLEAAINRLAVLEVEIESLVVKRGELGSRVGQLSALASRARSAAINAAIEGSGLQTAALSVVGAEKAVELAQAAVKQLDGLIGNAKHEIETERNLHGSGAYHKSRDELAELGPELRRGVNSEAQLANQISTLDADISQAGKS